ncbi:MAG: amino acid ABC transporter ATP-binding protein [Oscillospiraceae bacterium]|nr:amino acid ABC transporter ATP-binding protein [Oscillospiraceae bacterium]MBP1570654.1 amino acid ABC transporter ATP-binding protein [Oscillospiraceae bacterium]
MLKVTNLYKSFGDKTVLNNINFELGDGEILCLRGKSGAGKTTLIRCICNLDKADEGSIVIDGVESLENNRPNKNYQDKVGMVSQGLDLFPNLTVMENIALAPVSRKLMTKKQAEQKAMEILNSLGISDKANSYPAKLSGGEKQRAAVARACILSPSVLFFDEPTSALDIDSTQDVANLIEEIAANNISVVIITHDEPFCNMLNARTIVIKDGKIE